MRPDREEMLAGVRRALTDFIAPEVSSVFGRTQVAYAVNLISGLIREADTAVALLVEENRALRRLLSRAARRLQNAGLDPTLVAEVRALGPAPRRPDLRLTALRAENAGLLGLLVRIQAACEDADAAGRGAVAAVYGETRALLRQRVETQAAQPRR